MARRGAPPEVNAGSMADIAFLLLIFFLVTTTIETDAGLDRKLPPIEPPENPPIIKQKNIFTVVVNKNNQLLVEDSPMELKDLREAAKEFLDNGGGTGEKGETCDYCQGPRNPESSDHPNKAIISLQNDRLTEYGTYIAVQNELVAAYNELRNREAQRLFGEDFTSMDARYLDPKTPDGVKDDLKPKIERIQKMYPQKLSEAEPKSN
ncbi:ExbD/TolR family protein [Galbibacter mesophilus]|uniref:ExbD/TolR family protein n=1 Tax=Galbibacter mesophilus TaxID=379069 RepID=UPI00191DEE28|nr:biopolymer transporter ExbD [Galbibacter mesophilus]MCM5662575.1 biopolymer transporter ExbD [Galbibacter mesophilus]